MAEPPVPVRPPLVLMGPDDVEVIDPDDVDADDRKAIAWSLHLRGTTQTMIGRRFDVSRQTVNKWLKQYAAHRRSVAADVDYEAERLIGQLEAVAEAAWSAHEEVKGTAGPAGPAYLKVIIDSVKDIARLRGFDQVERGNANRGPIEVVVKIGGRDADTAVGVRVP